jgi:hypothetical protein
MSPEIRLRLVPAVLLCALLPACGSDNGPGDTTGNIDLFVQPPSTPFDPDGWAVTLDGGAERAVPDSGELLFENLAPGPHEVRVTDVDDPCKVSEDSPRTVIVRAAETKVVSISIVCDNEADIAITTTTTGEDLDPDGYLLLVDGQEAPGIGVNEHLTLGVPGLGAHEVTLSGIAPNCAVQGGPATRAVTVGAWETGHVDFEVVCTAIP